MIRRICIAVLVLAVVSQSTRAVDFTSPMTPGLGGCLPLSEPSAFDLLMVPCGRRSGSRFAVDLFNYDRYQLSEFEQYGAAGAIYGDKYALAIGVTQFGWSELYQETAERIAIGRRFGQFAVSLDGTVNSIEFGDNYSSLHSFSLGAGSYFEMKSVSLGIGVDQINSPGPIEGSPELPPKFTVYFEAWPQKSYSILARATRQSGQKTQYGAGQLVKLPYSVRLYWGISTEPLIYGAGLEFFAYKAFITCTASYHPVLGLSRMIAISFRAGGKQRND
ncbi:MAG TPA: hypothetical protein VJ983_02550 [candidate division Zixibacteria bacterium]|nr:hypothetical protein [candidate division Zixibacteria bacterium]